MNLLAGMREASHEYHEPINWNEASMKRNTMNLLNGMMQASHGLP